MAIWLNGARIVSLRERMVLERSELAEKSGVSYSTLSHVETGRRPVKADTARRIASALNVEAGELLGAPREAPRLRRVI